SATVEDPVYTPTAADLTAGSVTLTMTVTGTGAGCTSTTATDTIVITLSDAPTADAGDATSTICEGSSYKLVATATNGSIVWTANNGSGVGVNTGSFSDANIEDPTYTPSATDIAAGSVTLTMTVTGTGAGCTGETPSDAIVVTISPTSVGGS
ncbi:MAG: hypothetical protein JXQ93_14095, partial [Flavobacteriaceae bacterium]